MYNIVHSYIPFFVHSYFIINNHSLPNSNEPNSNIIEYMEDVINLISKLYESLKKESSYFYYIYLTLFYFFHTCVWFLIVPTKIVYRIFIQKKQTSKFCLNFVTYELLSFQF